MPDQTSPTPGICKVQFVNKCRPEWNVTIIAVACEFFYSDGNSFQDGPVAVNIPAGGDYSLQSNDPGKCVRKVNVALSAIRPGEGEQSYGPFTKDCPQCLQFFQALFGEQSTYAEQTAAAPKLTVKI